MIILGGPVDPLLSWSHSCSFTFLSLLIFKIIYLAAPSFSAACKLLVVAQGI